MRVVKSPEQRVVGTRSDKPYLQSNFQASALTTLLWCLLVSLIYCSKFAQRSGSFDGRFACRENEVADLKDETGLFSSEEAE